MSGGASWMTGSPRAIATAAGVVEGLPGTTCPPPLHPGSPDLPKVVAELERLARTPCPETP
jgi:hypothetical protein